MDALGVSGRTPNGGYGRDVSTYDNTLLGSNGISLNRQRYSPDRNQSLPPPPSIAGTVPGPCGLPEQVIDRPNSTTSCRSIPSKETYSRQRITKHPPPRRRYVSVNRVEHGAGILMQQ